MRSTIERIEGFPPELARAVLHIVLSHHGALENGSPVVPCTREATVVHAIDNLGGKLGSFDRLEKGLQDGETLVALRPRAVGVRVLRPVPRTTPRRSPSRCRSPCPPRRASSRTAQAQPGGPPMETGGEVRAPLGMSTAKDHKLGILVVALLAGASVRLDEI